MPSPALGILPAASSGIRFVIFKMGLTIIIANAYIVLCKCLIYSKTPAIICKSESKYSVAYNTKSHMLRCDVNQRTGASQQGTDSIIFKLTPSGFILGPCNNHLRELP